LIEKTNIKITNNHQTTITLYLILSVLQNFITNGDLIFKFQSAIKINRYKNDSQHKFLSSTLRSLPTIHFAFFY
jgi:hypothetical protein